jgi:O-antigen ligase
MTTPNRGPLSRLLAADPVALPALGALALLIAWAANQAGYPQTHWAPGGLILLVLLAIAIGVVGLRRAKTPATVRLALAGLAAYTALSFLSILWAKVPGDAWEGADRTLVYLVVFALFATWRRTAASAALLLTAWILALAGLALFTILHVDAVAGNSAQLQTLMPGGRLVDPAGYTNANAALWMIACFPAVLLASAKRMPWLARGLLAGAAVALASAALYSQSRGSVYSTPIVLALVFLLLPGRARTFATLVPIVAGVAVAVPSVLRLDEHIEAGENAVSAAHSATLWVLLATVLVALVVALAAAIESRTKISKHAEASVHRSVATVGVIALIGLVAGGLVAVGNPIKEVKHEWKTFTSLKGYGANEAGESRLISGLGSSRSDFYRVAWHEFVEHPLLGIGTDNFAVPYLRLRHSGESPRYPHSVELRVLSQTGIIGVVITLLGLGAALLACRRALRSADSLTRAVAAAALAGFGYWVVHGSFDWFFEYAGLGAAAFALLGLACSLSPPDPVGIALGGAGSATITVRGSGSGRAPRLLAAACAIVLALAAAASLAAPWLSRMEVESAGRLWPAAPAKAYARLREAARLNPLSDEPYLVAGSIALRLDQLDRADHQFELALRRAPDESYATLERGAIASARGERARALRLLRRAVELDPRDPLAHEALATAEHGTVDVVALNRSILLEAQQFS